MVTVQIFRKRLAHFLRAVLGPWACLLGLDARPLLAVLAARSPRKLEAGLLNFKAKQRAVMSRNANEIHRMVDENHRRADDLATAERVHELYRETIILGGHSNLWSANAKEPNVKRLA